MDRMRDIAISILFGMAVLQAMFNLAQYKEIKTLHKGIKGLTVIAEQQTEINDQTLAFQKSVLKLLKGTE
jgi:hypothetical protein